MWYSFAVKRQTMLMREKGVTVLDAAARYERRLFHGCPAHLVSKIAQQGFKRSFSGATSCVEASTLRQGRVLCSRRTVLNVARILGARCQRRTEHVSCSWTLRTRPSLSPTTTLGYRVLAVTSDTYTPHDDWDFDLDTHEPGD